MASNKISEEDIISFMRNMFGVSIARDQLQAPTKDFVVGVYARFLSEFGVENVSQPDIMATSGMDNIERYETNIIVANIYKSVANIVVNAGVPDMSFADVVQPKRLRTQRILSALCCLLLKLTEIEERFNQMQAKCIDLPVRRQAVEQRIRELRRAVEEKSMYLSSNKAKTEATAHELKALAETYERKRSEADALQDESRALKTTILSQREALSEIDVELSKLREEIQELDHKLVKSPERIQADTQDKETELESKRNEKKKLEKQYMELIRSLDHLKEGCKSLTPSLETFTEAFKDIESIRSECEKLSENKVLLNSREEKMKSLKVQIKEQEKSCHTLRQQIAGNEKTFQQQIQTLKQLNSGMKNDLDSKTKNQSEAQKFCLEERLRLESRLDALDAQHRQIKERVDTVFGRHFDAMKNAKNLIESRLNAIKDIKQRRSAKTK